MKFTKRTIILFLIIFFCPLLRAETMIVGTVYDATTGQPIPSANVFFKGTDDGCATSEEGVFCVRSNVNKKTLTLVVSAIGYKRQQYKIEQGGMGAVECYLQEDNTLLQDVFVSPDNSAVQKLMQSVREHKVENDISLQGIELQANEHKHLNISEIESKHLKRALWKKLRAGLVLDTTIRDDRIGEPQLMMPLYSSFTPYKVTGRQWQKQAETNSRAVLLTETDYQSLLSILPHQVNFYDNFIPLAGHNFVSPLAGNSNRYYKFYLSDSIEGTNVLLNHTIAQGKQYIVHFKSKNPYSPSFNGSLLIDSASHALTQFNVYIPKEVNVNYLRQSHFSVIYDTLHCPTRQVMDMVFDFAIKTDTSHTFPTVFIEQAVDYKNASNTQINQSINQPISNAAMDSLEQIPLIRVAKFAAEIIHTGYIPMGTAVDIGKVVDIVQANQHEGIRIGLPFRTNAKLWQNVCLEAYAAYGFGDRAWKGLGQIQFNLPTSRRNILGVKYWDRYMWQETSPLLAAAMENTVGYGNFGFTNALFTGFQQKQITNTATRRRELTIWTENDLTDYLETRFQFSTGRMGYGAPMVGYHNIPSYRFNSLSAMFRFGWKERKIDGYFQRTHIHSYMPIMRVYGEAGSYRFDDMQQDNLYAKLAVSVQQRVRLGICGRLDYLYQMGINFGDIPYNMQTFMPHNQTVAYDPYRFSLMPAWTLADKYIFLHAEWNMQGLLFNRIPGIRVLHLRELVVCKFAWGGLDTKKYANFNSLRIPYLELGIGIGNILRVADVYFLYRPVPQQSSAPNWTIKFRLDLGL